MAGAQTKEFKIPNITRSVIALKQHGRRNVCHIINSNNKIFTFAITSGSTSGTGSAQSTIMGVPQRNTEPGVNFLLAIAAMRWSSNSKNTNPRFSRQLLCARYMIISFNPSTSGWSASQTSDSVLSVGMFPMKRRQLSTDL